MFGLSLSQWRELPVRGENRQIGTFPKGTSRVSIRGGYVYISRKEYGYNIRFPNMGRVRLVSNGTSIVSFEATEFNLYERLSRGQYLWIPLGDGDALKIET